MEKWLLTLFILLSIPLAYAATIEADSCSQAHVQAAIDSAATGDTVMVPGGSCSWSSGVSIPSSKGITLDGGGAVISGSIRLDQGTATSRITNFRFIGQESVFIGGSKTSAPFRIDKNIFESNQGGSVLLTTFGNGPGLIDHNQFLAPTNSEMIHNMGMGASSDAGWKDDVVPGSPDAVYIEDNEFINNDPSFGTANPAYHWGSSAIQSYYGARTVFRHNYLLMSHVDQHGTGGMIGARWWEIYENTFSTDVPHASQCCFITLRAGSGVVFNNHHIGENLYGHSIDLYEEDTGYPALYQVGRGKNQVLEPAYLWGNDDFFSIGSQTPDMVQEGRDYHIAQKPGYTPYTYPHPLRQTSNDIIPAGRITDWSRSQVGVPGGIPQRTENCMTTACNTLYSGTVTAASINNAIASAPANTVVRIPVGTYSISSRIDLKSDITLRGAGMDSTVLNIDFDGDAVHTTQLGKSDARAIQGGYEKGSDTIQVSSTQGVEPGMLVIIAQDREPGLVYGNGPWDDPDRPFGQTVRVEAVDGQSITYWPALHYGFSSSLNPIYRYFGHPTEFAGIEELTLDYGTKQSFAGVWFDACYGCWIKKVESRYATNMHFFFTNSVANEIRETYMYETNSENDGFGVGLYQGTTNFLVEDNIMESSWCLTIMGNTVGSVIAYNYAYDTHTNVWPHQTPGYNANHMAHGAMTLWEGNVGQQWQNDGYHGSCSHQTLFRNRFHGLSPQYTTNRKMLDLTHWSYYHNIVGNILGDSSWEPDEYDMTGSRGYDHSVVYRLGYVNMGNNDVSGQDAKVKETIFRHGNYDYFNDATIWEPGVDHEIPDSLVYDSKPAWFGSVPWPPIGPDVPGYYNKIPAQLRFEGQGCGPMTISELSAVIEQWKDGTINIIQVMQSILEWKSGC